MTERVSRKIVREKDGVWVTFQGSDAPERAVRTWVGANLEQSPEELHEKDLNKAVDKLLSAMSDNREEQNLSDKTPQSGV